MPTRYHAISAGLLLLIANASVQAESNVSEEAPFQPHVEPVEMPQPRIAPAIDQKYDETQAYRLEYKFRAPDKQQNIRRIKSELPAAGGLAVRPGDPPVFVATADDAPNLKLAIQPFSNEIASAARNASLDPALVHAVIYVESRYRHDAVSNKGAMGLMQVLPMTAARYGIKDPGESTQANLKAGTLYLRDLMRMFDNRLDLVLAAYNAGEGAVLKYARTVPPYRETRQYVLSVTAKYHEWRNPEAADLQPAPPSIAVLAKPPRKDYLSGTQLVLLGGASAYRY